MNSLGTDIDSNCSFSDGDINLVSGIMNLGQAIVNRLNTDAGFYQGFYSHYGGNLFDELGELNNGNAHEYLRIEIESILRQDPRIKGTECTITKIASDTVKCNLKVQTIAEDEFVELNLVITPNNGVIIEEML